MTSSLNCDLSSGPEADTESDRDYYDGRPVGPHNFCEEFIEVNADPWAGTYCKLLAGHDGAHSAHYPKEKP
jgi:hypothetical protein